MYPVQLNLAATPGFDRHRLRLQGIHTREPPDQGLIEFHRLGRFGGRCLQSFEFFTLPDQLSLEFRVIDAATLYRFFDRNIASFCSAAIR